MSNQIELLEKALNQQKELYEKLQRDFQQSAHKIDQQDNLLSVQARNAVMGEMISVIAHQWRQPLNIIGVMVQSFKDAWDYDELSEEYINNQVKVVMDQIRYLSETITDFRDFFKPKLNTAFDLKEVVLHSLHLTDFFFKRSEIALSTSLDDNCMLNGNSNELVQVLLNLINNARQVFEEYKTKEPVLRIDLKRIDDSAELKIYNNGERISEKDIDQIFDPYFTTKGDKGSGIGLYISRVIVQNKYNGSIEVENTDRGVLFTIKLPLTASLPSNR